VLLALSSLAASSSCGRPAPLDHGRASASGAQACPPGSELGRSGCTCRPDLRPVLGACVSPRTAADFCGPTALPTDLGCSPRPPCDPGRALDLGSGACLPRLEVRAIAVGLGILVGDEQRVGCPHGGLLVASSDGAGGPSQLGCIKGPSAPAGRTCPAGAVAAADGTCVRVYDGKSVDVVSWLHAVVTPAAPAPSPLCEALARGPGALAPQRAAASGAGVSLVFPDNDVSLVRLSSTAAELERAFPPMIEALRSLGGTASQAALSLRVSCAPVPAPALTERPAAVIPENDHEK